MTYTNEEGIACTGCEYRSENSIDTFGHTRCSVHRPCTGSKYWEPSNCEHCKYFETCIKDLNHGSRLAYMGKLKGLLEKVQTKVNEIEPHREWEYSPIFESNMRKFNFSQPQQPNVQTLPRLDRSLAASPIDQDMLQANNEEMDLDSDDQSDSGNPPLNLHRGNSDNVINDDFCTALHCVKSDNYAQCTDEVHNVHEELLPIGANNIPVLEPGNNYRSQSPVSWVGNEPPQNIIYSSPEIDSGTTQEQLPERLPEERCQQDIFSSEYWVKFAPRVHKKEPNNIMIVKSHCPTTGLIIKKKSPVIYKSDKGLLFQVTKTRKPTDVWIDNSEACASYSTSLDMPPTTSVLLNKTGTTTCLDSHVPEDSGLMVMLLELQKIGPEITRLVMSMKVEEVEKYILEHCKCFTPHGYINLVTGFPLSNQEYAKFLQDKPLNVRRFESQVGSIHGCYTVAPNLLNKEKEDRAKMCYTLSTLHLLEQFVLKVEKVSDQEKTKIRLCPKTGRGITKRFLVNVKSDVITWMTSKMAVRKSLLPNLLNFNVILMLESSLWGHEIFSKEAFEKLQKKNVGKNDLQSLLGIKGKIPIDIQNMASGSGYNDAEPMAKKMKLMQTQPPQTKQGGNKRGNRGGQKNYKGNNNPQQSFKQKGKNKGYGKGSSNQQTQNQNQYRNNNNKKTFQKGKQESNK